MKNTHRILPVVLVLLFLGAAAPAQTKRPMTPEDVVSLNRASDAQLSPDARRVAFVASSWDRENDKFNSDVWLVDEMRQVVRLTSNPRRDDSPRWSPDARRIAFLSERAGDSTAQGAQGDAQGIAQIFLLNPMGGEPVQLTSHKTPIQSFEWSPDGRLIAFIAVEAREKGKTKPPVVVDEDNLFAQLWVVDVASREIKQLTRGSRHITALNWSWDSSQIVFTARSTPKLIDSQSTEVFVTPVNLQNAPYDTAQSRQLTKGGGVENQPQFSPDGRWVSYLAHAGADVTVGPESVHVIPAAGGEARQLAANYEGYITSYR